MATAKKAAPAKRAPNAAFMKPMNISPALAAVIGATPIPRTEVTKKIWEYIKKNNLQDAANKRNINADDKLKVIFGKPQVTMFEMTKLIQGNEVHQEVAPAQPIDTAGTKDEVWRVGVLNGGFAAQHAAAVYV